MTTSTDSAASAGRATILVVEDDESMRQLIGLHLTNAGYVVVLAEDAVVGGYSALKCAPDLILLDVNMPYMDGYQFAEVLKGDPSLAKVPVVFLSSRDDVVDARRFGAVACLQKPLAVKSLLETVARHCS
jgi:DNA-binding response OmpR family regulator